jgi:GNAT superfamily N-acetyltransferase
VSTPPWTVRAVRPEDAGNIVELVHDCFEEYREIAPPGWDPPADRRGPRERMEVALARSTTGGVVGEAAGAHAGHVLWIPAVESERMSTSDPEVAYLWELFVARAHRGSGLATRLLADAVEASLEGYAEMRLLTPRDQARARRFYEREGWSFMGDWGVDSELRLPIVEYGLRLRSRQN